MTRKLKRAPDVGWLLRSRDRRAIDEGGTRGLGAGSNLLHQGIAKETDDPDVVSATSSAWRGPQASCGIQRAFCVTLGPADRPGRRARPGHGFFAPVLGVVPPLLLIELRCRLAGSDLGSHSLLRLRAALSGARRRKRANDATKCDFLRKKTAPGP
jgi:hypothetical protein